MPGPAKHKSNTSARMKTSLSLASVYHTGAACLFDWSYRRVNVSEEPEPLEGKKATALATMVQSMQVEFYSVHRAHGHYLSAFL